MNESGVGWDESAGGRLQTFSDAAVAQLDEGLVCVRDGFFPGDHGRLSVLYDARRVSIWASIGCGVMRRTLLTETFGHARVLEDWDRRHDELDVCGHYCRRRSLQR